MHNINFFFHCCELTKKAKITKSFLFLQKKKCSDTHSLFSQNAFKNSEQKKSFFCFFLSLIQGESYYFSTKKPLYSIQREGFPYSEIDNFFLLKFSKLFWSTSWQSVSHTWWQKKNKELNSINDPCFFKKNMATTFTNKIITTPG